MRWTIDVDEYHRMGEAGILTEDDRVDLVEGELLGMTPTGAGHTAAVIGPTRSSLSANPLQVVVCRADSRCRAFTPVRDPL